MKRVQLLNNQDLVSTSVELLQYTSIRLVNRRVAAGKDRLRRDTADRRQRRGIPMQRGPSSISRNASGRMLPSQVTSRHWAGWPPDAVRYFGQDEMPREEAEGESDKPLLPSYKPVHKGHERRTRTTLTSCGRRKSQTIEFTRSMEKRWLCTFGALLRDCGGKRMRPLELHRGQSLAVHGNSMADLIGC
ncbi:hypothetical protein BDP81DRAFT_54109 [Colletotrichum phormii]|uniref:Uncharacterized protein n=1 Tax=Colletotrichum phormii TaxID=359342 RepID=A0AAI9ZMV4_9PEZI|nr:uncharacterized protein BDP81DRAFT_54109 [Colletotrichum phormii]KAK1634873.1 hypothetical protein BDP81DRAFT_54109 [Colletotrichum phormii]